MFFHRKTKDRGNTSGSHPETGRVYGETPIPLQVQKAVLSDFKFSADAGATRQPLRIRIRLTAADVDLECAGFENLIPVFINQLHCAAPDFKRNTAAFPCGELDTRECAKLMPRYTGGGFQVADIDFNNLFAIYCAGIGNSGADMDAFACGNGIPVDGKIAIGKFRIAQAVAERIQRVFLKEFIGTVVHCVIDKRWDGIGFLIEGNRKLPGEVCLAGNQAGKRAAAKGARIPAVDDGVCFFVGNAEVN